MAARKKSIFDGILYVINTILAFLLMASYLSSYIDPRLISWFSFLGLAYPYLLLSNIIFAIYWALRLKLKIVLSIVAITIGYNHLGELYQFSGSNQVVASGSTLKVMSYNVRMLNHFDWLDIPDIPKKIEDLILDENPDILQLQEYRQISPELKVKLNYKYSSFTARTGATGQITYSRYPIIAKEIHEFAIPDSIGTKRKAIICDIEWQGRPIRLINVHLASVGLKDEDYDNLSSLSNKNQDQITEGISKVGSDLKAAFIRRAHQVENLEKLLADSPYPIILSGDFNDPPTSYTYQRIITILKDSFTSAGSGLVRTYNRGPIPLRIDYILYSSEMRCYDYKVRTETLSDHYPVIAEFGFL
jgi:vancomycin resistance protein VanJ